MTKSRRTQALVQLLLFIGIAIFLNVLGNFLFTKFDLTEDGRFTLTQPSRQLLTELDEVVYIQVLLDGELPAGIKRLQKATQEILDDFRSYSGFIDYEFVNPGAGTKEEINAARTQLEKDGIAPTMLRVKSNDETRELLFYTYAIVHYKNRTIPVNLVDKAGGVLDDVTINNSVSLLEYKLADAIQKLQAHHRPTIAFLKGHGELEELQTQDLRRSLRPFYNVGFYGMDSAYAISQDIKVLVIAKPQLAFSERDKFLLDQYVMNGGKIVWLIDRMAVNLDSMYTNPEFIPMDYPLNLDDQLFKYGTRVEPNLLLDMQCTKIPLVVDQSGTTDMFDWYYHPVVVPDSEHPIVKNLDGVNFFFPSRIDTIRTKTNVKKTILMTTSPYSREQYSPVRLNFEVLRYKADPDKFNKGRQPLAVLLEGEFPSLYENRVSDNMNKMLAQIERPFKAKSVATKMIVISDGDIAKNMVHPETQTTSPLGFNPYVRYTFANKNFLVNAIEYLLDDRGVIEARAKEVKLRPLDTVKAQSEQAYWQVFNLVLPLVFLVFFGGLYTWIRRRRFAH